MYLHIGKDVVIQQKEIIAILAIEAIQNKKSLEEICKSLKIYDNIIDVSEQNMKSLVLVKKDEEIRGYITNISSMTLAKRAQEKACLEVVKENGKI